MSQPELVVVGDAEALARAAADRVIAGVRAAVAARGVARVALSGGRTPGGAYRWLAQAALPWEHIVWLWVDERCVPPDDARSNYGAAKSVLFGPAAVPEHTVHRMAGELGAVAGARDYDAWLVAECGTREPVIDVVVAGIGDDGHTASLFPGTGAVDRADAAVIAVEPGGELEPRITLARPVLQRARSVLVLASGASKRAPIAAALSPGPLDAVPARLYLEARATYLVDEAARP